MFDTKFFTFVWSEFLPPKANIALSVPYVLAAGLLLAVPAPDISLAITPVFEIKFLIFTYPLAASPKAKSA